MCPPTPSVSFPCWFIKRDIFNVNMKIFLQLLTQKYLKLLKEPAKCSVTQHQAPALYFIYSIYSIWYHTCPGDLSTSMWVSRDNSYFPHHYSHSRWRIYMSRKISLANFCTVAKISGEFAKALKMTFLGLKTIYIFIIHTKE